MWITSADCRRIFPAVDPFTIDRRIDPDGTQWIASIEIARDLRISVIVVNRAIRADAIKQAAAPVQER